MMRIKGNLLLEIGIMMRQNKQKVIQEFIVNNYQLLTYRQIFERKKYEQYKKTFFGEIQKYKYGIPKDNEIAHELVSLIIKKNKTNSIDKLNHYLSSIPFLKLLNINPEDYEPLLSQYSKTYALHENISGVKGIQKIEDLKNSIIKEKSEDIEKAIEKKKTEYKNLPSILEDEEYVEPEIKKKIIEDKEWWIELNLRSNPFPGPLDGFFLLDKSLYEHIIVETDPIKWIESKIDKNEDEFFHKAFLVAGDFGTGKTTFYDYLAPKLTFNKIEPIRVAIADNISVSHYMQTFERKLTVEVFNLCKKMGISSQINTIDFVETAQLLLSLQKTKNVKGFFIFIDDLHKNTQPQIVFSFLSNLQIIKNTFSRQGINAGFFVAGLPYWEGKIKKDTSLTGFFDSATVLKLPIITPKLAALAIKKRLQAFSNNPEKPIQIRQSFLELVFKKESAEIGNSNIGFRPYIQSAIVTLEDKKFDILDIDFTTLTKSKRIEIKEILESHKDFKDSIDKLIYGSKIQKKESRTHTLKILCDIFLRKGIKEDQTLFFNNKFHFKKLMESNLIVKYRKNKEIQWRINPFIVQINSEIIENYGLSIEDYLVQIYSLPSKVPQKKKSHSRIHC